MKHQFNNCTRYSCLFLAFRQISKIFKGVDFMTDEVTYKLLKAIEKCSKTNQRKLAEDLGVSLGRVNFLLNELVEYTSFYWYEFALTCFLLAS